LSLFKALVCLEATIFGVVFEKCCECVGYAQNL
jgi:hypothetical protein